MTSIVLVGAAGRMGRAVDLAAAAADDFEVKARVEREVVAGTPGPGGRDAGPIVGIDRLGELLSPGDVAVEFSAPDGCAAAARACAERGAALVSGTTGLDADVERAIEAAAKRVAVLRAANFSLGLLALRRAIAAAVGRLPAGWDVEIVERHHRGKVDSPSGTALALVREVARARGENDPQVRSGREGRIGPRPAGEIGVHAIRGGTWTGDHAVLVAGPGESIELRHVVEDRAAFAHGVLAAARFVAVAAPGLYNLEDVPPPPGRTG